MKEIELYNTDIKQEYRENVWKMLLEKNHPKGKYLFFSGPQGKEVDVLRAMGIADKDMIMIDEKVGKVARAKAMRKCKEALAKAGKLSQLSKYFKKNKIEIAIANLDFCGTLGGDLLTELRLFLKSGCLAPISRIGVTYQRGRELKVLKELFNIYKVSNREDLIAQVVRNEGFNIRKISSDEYKNHRSPMAWMVFHLNDTKQLLRPCKTVARHISYVVTVSLERSDKENFYLSVNRDLLSKSQRTHEKATSNKKTIACFVLTHEHYDRYLTNLNHEFDFDGKLFHVPRQSEDGHPYKDIESFAKTTTFYAGRVDCYHNKWPKLTGCCFTGYRSPRFDHYSCEDTCRYKQTLRCGGFIGGVAGVITRQLQASAVKKLDGLYD
jgi:hypothetical protein